MAASTSVVVHPLVLLSVVDHYNRVAKARRTHASVTVAPADAALRPRAQDTRKRVVGILLGEVHKGRLDVTNSYAGESRARRG